MPDRNKAVIGHCIEAVDRGDLDALPELFSPDVVAHEPAGESRGIDDGPRKAVTMLRAAFPDFHITIDDQVAEGDRVAVRWTATGAHIGEFAGIPPTGRQVTLTAIYIYRLSNGRIAEAWASPDTLGLLQQLGAIPGPA